MIPENPPALKVTAITTQVNHHRPNGETVTVLFGVGKGHKPVKLEFDYAMAVEVARFMRVATLQVEHARNVREAQMASHVVTPPKPPAPRALSLLERLAIRFARR